MVDARLLGHKLSIRVAQTQQASDCRGIGPMPGVWGRSTQVSPRQPRAANEGIGRVELRNHGTGLHLLATKSKLANVTAGNLKVGDAFGGGETRSTRRG
jgi:hypothetical protein